MPGEFIQGADWNNKKINCLDRSDEVIFDDFNVRSSCSNVSLIDCTNDQGAPGYLCTDPHSLLSECVLVGSLCHGGGGSSRNLHCVELNGKHIDDAHICGNFTLWKNKPCYQPSPFGNLTSESPRCQGRSSGQCAYTSDFYGECMYQSNCLFSPKNYITCFMDNEVDFDG